MLPNNLQQTAAALAARDQFAATGLPGAKSEPWIYTRLQDVVVNPAQSAEVATSSEAGLVLHFDNGLLVSDDLTAPAGMVIRPFTDADMADFAAYLPDDHLLGTLSVGHVTSAIMIEVEAGAQISDLLTLRFTANVADQSAHPLVFIKQGAGSQCRIVEHHESHAALSAPLIVMDIGAEAVLDHAKMQADTDSTKHLSLTVMAVAEKADINSFTTAIGGQLARHETHMHLNGEHADVALSSIYMARGTQHQDMTTRMLHHVPNCTSSQLIRGVLDDTAKGVFQGKVVVARDAQKTDGQQMSRALLLSRQAEADAKPELEIYADDVVCSHGATVGELDETHLFYLKSRGIEADEARMMLIEAFLLDTLETVRLEELRASLTAVIQRWMTGV